MWTDERGYDGNDIPSFVSIDVPIPSILDGPGAWGNWNCTDIPSSISLNYDNIPSVIIVTPDFWDEEPEEKPKPPTIKVEIPEIDDPKEVIIILEEIIPIS